MYVPRHSHFFISLAISLTGFYIRQKIGGTYDVVIVFAVFQFHAIMHVIYIVVAGALYQMYMTDYNERRSVRAAEVQPVQELDVLKPIPDLNQPPVYSQTVTLPRFDKERNFAITLLRMNEHTEGSADLTEKRWVASGKFTRGEFVAMLDNWQSREIITRKSAAKNAPYIVTRWEAVRLVAEGNPLSPALPY